MTDNKSAKARGLRLLEQWGDDLRVRRDGLDAYYTNPPKPVDESSLPAGMHGEDRGYLPGGQTGKPHDDPQEALFRHCQVERGILAFAQDACAEVDQLVRDHYEIQVATNVRALCRWTFAMRKPPERFPDNATLMVAARLFGADNDWLREFVRRRLDKLACVIGEMDLARVTPEAEAVA
jgi:hypothetical protein